MRIFINLFLIPSLSLLLTCKKEVEKMEKGEILAVVNGENILAEDFEKEWNLNLYQSQNSIPSPESKREIRRNILGKMIDTTLLLQEARKRNITATPEEVEEHVKKVAKDYPGETFYKFLKENAIPYDTWVKKIAEMIIIQKLFNSISGNAPPVNEEEIYIYYKTHAKEFQSKEKVMLRQILLADADTADKVMKRLKNGEAFEQLVKEVSIGYESKQGGMLPYLSRDELPKELEGVFDLKIGNIMGPRKTDYGYHIVRVEKRLRTKKIPLESARGNIIEAIRREKQEKELKEWLSSLRREAKIIITSSVQTMEEIQ